MNNRINYYISISIFLIFIISAYILIQKSINSIVSNSQCSFTVKKDSNEDTSQDATTPQLGKLCNYPNSIKDTNGLQCHLFAYPSDDRLKMPKVGGVWIYPHSPNSSAPHHIDYFYYIKNFKEYSNQDLSFKYPANGRLDDSWKGDGTIQLSMGNPEVEPIWITINLYNEKFEKDKFLDSIKSDHNYARISDISDCGEECDFIRIEAIPSISVSSNTCSYYLIFPRNNKYVVVSANNNDDTYGDFLTEAFLQSIKVK